MNALADAVAVAGPWMRHPHPEAGETASPLTDLLAPARLRGLLDAHRHDRGTDACPRAAASIWSKHLMSALLPAASLAALAGADPAPDPLLAMAEGMPRATIAAPPGRLAANATAAALERWIAEVLADAVARLAAASALAPRVFWSNAATMLAYLCERWEKVDGVEAATIRGLLSAPRLAGDANPLAGQITYVATSVPAWPRSRRRRICCLRDRLGQRLCAGCPKIDPAERDRILAAAAG